MKLLYKWSSIKFKYKFDQTYCRERRSLNINYTATNEEG